MLDLTDALNIMDNGDWFKIAYVGCDRKRGEAGRLIRIDRCRLATAANSPTIANNRQNVAIHGTNDQRNPNHADHATRNLRLANGQIRKVHIRTITSINGQALL